jgi:tripartite-type tricarboxylate transporter receptor subunit TctC
VKLLHRRQFLHLTARATALPAVSRIARAQSYPTRPITMIVPAAAGGATDVSARIVSEHMSRTLGQQIVIENIAGAGGTTGTARTMRANPDGYTIEMGHMGTHALAVVLYPKLAYKPEVDFEPISIVSAFAMVILARKDFPPNDLKEFASFVKANSNKLNVAHAGVGSIFEAYPVDSGLSRCSMLSDRIGAVARADTDGEGAVARGIPEVVSR